jgi:hypothetical protein
MIWKWYYSVQRLGDGDDRGLIDIIGGNIR